jgi:uncharacterized membrane protein YhaH (DUF805 family)
MPDDPISNQINRIGHRRLAGCAIKFLALLALGCVVLGITVRRTHDPGIRLAVALGISGLLFGFYASLLSPRAAKFLTRVFVLLPLVVTLTVFAYRTLFGRAEELPLRLVLAPLALALGFLIGRGRRTSA